MTGSDGHLARRVAKSAATIAFGRIAVRLIGLANTLIVARLLTPDDFGLVALGVVVMQILEQLSEVSVSRTVVKFRDAGRELFDTLFTLSIIKGVLVLGVMLALAPLAVGFYDDTRVDGIFVALGLVSLVRSVRNPRFHEFERDLDFSRELLVGVLTKVVSVALSIAIALHYESYWAIVAGIAAGVVLEVILSFWLKPFLPKLSFAAFRQLISFTGWLSAAGALIAINNKLGPLVLGRIVGTGPTGAYYVGGQLAAMVGRELAQPIVKALYPGLSSLQGQPDRMRYAYLRGAEAMAAIVAPAAFGLSFVAKDFTTLVLGEGWDMAALVVGVVTPVYGLVAVLGGVQSLAMATGKVRPLFVREFVYLLCHIPILVFSAKFYGLEGAVWGSVVASLIFLALQCRLYAMTAEDHWWQPLWAARRGLLALIPMTVWFKLIRPEIVPIEALPIFARLGVDAMTGAAIYVVSLAALWVLEGRPDGLERQAVLMTARRAS